MTYSKEYYLCEVLCEPITSMDDIEIWSDETFHMRQAWDIAYANRREGTDIVLGYDAGDEFVIILEAKNPQRMVQPCRRPNRVHLVSLAVAARHPSLDASLTATQALQLQREVIQTGMQKQIATYRKQRNIL